MKKLFIYAAVVAAAMGSMTSCSDFLEVKPVTNKQEPDFVSQEGVTQLLTGMYARLNSTDANDGYFRSTLTNYVYGDVMGGMRTKVRRIKTNQTLPAWRPIHLPQITLIWKPNGHIVITEYLPRTTSSKSQI